MRQYCTYFDHRYLSRGLALLDSMRRHGDGAALWVLCLSDACYDALRKANLEGVHPVRLTEFESGDEPLLRAKGNRSIVEYYFTCTASWVLYVFRQCATADSVVYLDADLFYFSSDRQLDPELRDASVAIIGHRFGTNLRHLERHGIYNVGWLLFRRDQAGLACLNWWRERCIEWCYDRCEDGKFADQKYLDDWTDRFPGTVALRHKGANLAPWNIANYQIKPGADGVMVDGEPLIFFHFHSLKRMNAWLWNPSFSTYGATVEAVVRQAIYRPYLQALADCDRRAAQLLGAPAPPPTLRYPMADSPAATAGGVGGAWRRFRLRLWFWKCVAKGQYLTAPGGRLLF